MSPASAISTVVAPYLPKKDNPQTIPVTYGSAATSWPGLSRVWPGPRFWFFYKSTKPDRKREFWSHRKVLFPTGRERIQHFKHNNLLSMLFLKEIKEENIPTRHELFMFTGNLTNFQVSPHESTQVPGSE